MKKINFLAPVDEAGSASSSKGGSVPPSTNDPNLQLLKEMYPGRVTLTVQEVADVLAKSDDFIYERLGTGAVKGTRTGRNWVIPITEVARLLNEGVS